MAWTLDGVAAVVRLQVAKWRLDGLRGRWRATGVLLGLVGLLALGGCAGNPAKGGVGAGDSVAAVEPLSEYLDRAQAAAAQEGGRELARQIYRDAARAYPTDKRPWLRLAQSYFDATDYGNAVLAAQEVVQRDGGDETALGLLAVSGLRISTSALADLRERSSLNKSTRSEAENMALILRTILGESVLVPQPSSPTTAPAAAPKRRAPPPSRKPAAQAATPPTAPETEPAPANPGNPFGALK
jgi:hypothetical protein